MPFKTLTKEIQNLIADRGWSEPTLVQEKAIPRIMDGENLLIIAPTGIGKTESAMLPIFSMVHERNEPPISILYITPLKALNRDMFDRLIWWAEKLNLEVGVRHGDTTDYERRKQVEFPPHLLITTPETLQAILTGTKMREHLKNVKHVVVDEVHELVESKRGTQLSIALERLKEISGDFQIIGLSATVGSPEEVARFLGGGRSIGIVKAMTAKDMEILVDSPSPTSEDRLLSERIFLGEDATARLRRIHELVETHRGTLVFTNTREAAEVLSSRLRKIETNYKHDIHHGSLSKDVRVYAEKKFKEEELRALICTSSLELGIDIGSIDLVIQYMSPRQVSKLVQRIGRSGHRVGEKSKGIIIAADPDDILESVVIARKAMSNELEDIRFNKLSLDVLANQIIGLSLEYYDLDRKRIYNIITRSYLYSNLTEEKFDEVLNFLEDLKILYTLPKVRRKRKSWNYYFENLSTIPDTFQYRVIDNIEKKDVGVLDEGFVAEHGTPGTTFVVKGSSWRILSVEDGKVYVEPVDDMESAIPAWEGELIPVPESVALEVSELRYRIYEMLKEGIEPDEIY
ncbi:MAG: helicase, partial [Candidatus Aenigmatarchaeota archaeon]